MTKKANKTEPRDIQPWNYNDKGRNGKIIPGHTQFKILSYD